MATKPRKHVYHVGDEVVITEPRVVLRVGYPLGLQEAHQHVDTTYGKDIRELLWRVTHKGETPLRLFDSEDPLMVGLDSCRPDKVMVAFAYAYLLSEGFGGKTRSLHTELREGLCGKRAYIQSKRTVKTGTYRHGSTSYGYDGADHKPPYLSNIKSHVLLELHGGGLSYDESYQDDRPLEVEETNVVPYVAPWVAAEQGEFAHE